jgi:hypothetical protein
MPSAVHAPALPAACGWGYVTWHKRRQVSAPRSISCRPCRFCTACSCPDPALPWDSLENRGIPAWRRMAVPAGASGLRSAGPPLAQLRPVRAHSPTHSIRLTRAKAAACAAQDAESSRSPTARHTRTRILPIIGPKPRALVALAPEDGGAQRRMPGTGGRTRTRN